MTILNQHAVRLLLQRLQCSTWQRLDPAFRRASAQYAWRPWQRPVRLPQGLPLQRSLPRLPHLPQPPVLPNQPACHRALQQAGSQAAVKVLTSRGVVPGRRWLQRSKSRAVCRAQLEEMAAKDMCRMHRGIRKQWCTAWVDLLGALITQLSRLCLLVSKPSQLVTTIRALVLAVRHLAELPGSQRMGLSPARQI